jgi:hypothetical protein
MFLATARGKIFVEETLYARGTNFTDFRASDKELEEKFRNNATLYLKENKIARAVESIFNLEKMKDINEMTSLLVL